jgi:uncharacterized protein YcbK (DUF882 family)
MTLPATHYTKNFSRRELACKCGCKIVPTGIAANLAQLAQALQQLRDLAGVPLIVTSGHRCPQHNAAVGGAKGSQHMQGIAADIWSKHLTPVELKALAEKIPAFANGGIGLYSRWVHVDTRKGPARW